MTFSDRLAAAIADRGRLCVGIDPHPSMLERWGLEASVAGLERCARTMAEALAGTVAVAKPQSAFFELFGSAGIAVLERTLADLRAGGVLTLLDIKRGDIGSTMAAYAAAYLHPASPLAADAITVSPYLGFGALQPALDLARENDRGIYVLARTSNPDSADVQGAQAGAVSLAQSIVDQARAADDAAGTPYVGVVVGGTHDDLGVDLTGFDGSVLVPGLGAQGAIPADLVRRFAGHHALLLPTTSRQVMAAGPSVEALREASLSLRTELSAAGL